MQLILNQQNCQKVKKAFAFLKQEKTVKIIKPFGVNRKKSLYCKNHKSKC